MALSDIVDVRITRVSSAVTQQGFSTPLILAYHLRQLGDRVRAYTSLDEMTAEGFTPDDAAHKIASAIWSQPNPPRTVKVGRRANAFTQSIRLTPTAPVASNAVYALEIDGQTVTYTSDADATATEIAEGLADAINEDVGATPVPGLADANAIASGASALTLQTLSGASLNGVLGYRPLSPPRRLQLVLNAEADWLATTATVTGKDSAGNTITETFAIPAGGDETLLGTKLFARVTSVAIPMQDGTAGTFTLGVRAPMTATAGSGPLAGTLTLAGVAGHVHAVEVTRGSITIEDLTTNPGLAADITAVRAEDDDWYGLLLDSNSRAELLAVAAIVEPLDPRKILLGQSADDGCINPDSITDVGYLTKDLGYFRTHVSYHPGSIGKYFIAAALVGNAMAYDPGSVTWVHRELVGIPDWAPTSAERTALLGKNMGSVETVAGRKITFGGKVAGGEWIDIIHGLDWLHARTGERIFGVFVAAQDAKIGFTDKGIERIHAELRAQLTEAEGAPYNLLNPGWSTAVPRAAALTSQQRATRTLPGVTWAGTVQGAIHAVQIRGTVAA
jgi:hypothetical protein